MHQRRKVYWIRPLIPLCFVVMSVQACGDDDDDGDNGNTTAGAANLSGGAGGTSGGSTGNGANAGEGGNGASAGEAGDAGGSGEGGDGGNGAGSGGADSKGGSTGSGGIAGTAGSAGSSAGSGGLSPGPGPSAPEHFVYIESNDPAGNAVLAFARRKDGSLKPVSGGRYATGGTGISAGASQRRGPLDSDNNLVLSEDRRWVFAVNSGDSTIAVFRIKADGVLKPVMGSPFFGGGKNPVSVGQGGNKLYAVNKEADGMAQPSYAVLEIGKDGMLSLIKNSTVKSALGGSPSIAYVSPSGGLLFGTQFFDGARPNQAPIGQIDVFSIDDSGKLKPAPFAPFALPPEANGILPRPRPVALNLVSHPTESILYVAFVTRNQLGVYEYDERGALTFLRAVPNSGAGICRFLINEDASSLYSVNAESATISRYDLADPRYPVETSQLELLNAESGQPFIDATGSLRTVTSQPFQLAFGPKQRQLYVVSQRVTTNPFDLAGNYLHTLQIAADDSLSEPKAPIDLRDLDVPPAVRPQGMLVF